MSCWRLIQFKSKFKHIVLTETLCAFTLTSKKLPRPQQNAPHEPAKALQKALEAHRESKGGAGGTKEAKGDQNETQKASRKPKR